MLVLLGLAAAAVGTTKNVVDVLNIDLTLTSVEPFPHFWKKTFGSGHAALTMRQDWRSHLKLAQKELGLKGVRYHGIFDDDNGPVVTTNASLGNSPLSPAASVGCRNCSYSYSYSPEGKFAYNWTNVLDSWDYQVAELGQYFSPIHFFLCLTPIVELSFMPALLANCSWNRTGYPAVNPSLPPCSTIMVYKGVQQPPTDYTDWYNLVHALATQAVKRYTLEKVKTWRFEVWNELWGMPFCSGKDCRNASSPYMTLYAASAKALKDVDQSLQVGGPATAMLENVADFVAVCKAHKIPFDFVSTHHYPSDPDCPGRRGVPTWDPECWTNGVKAAAASVKGAAPFVMSEYSNSVMISRGEEHDSSEAAAFIFRQIGALTSQGVDTLSWWTFTDIFEEGGLPIREFQNYYGLRTYNGIPKPSWRAFELLHTHAGNKRVPVTMQHNVTNGPPNVWVKTKKPLVTAFATTNSSAAPLQGSSGSGSGSIDASLRIFLGYWFQPTGVGASGGLQQQSPPSTQPNHTVALKIKFIPTSQAQQAPPQLVQYRIDDDHANPLAAYKAIGSPKIETISPQQLAALAAASVVVAEPLACVVDADGSVLANVTMTPNAAVVVGFA